MALTQKYCTPTGAGGHTGNDWANAWTLVEAAGAGGAVAGDKVNCDGAFTIAGDLACANAGNVISPIVWSGCDGVIDNGDQGRTNDSGLLITTNFATLSTGNFNFNLSSYSHMEYFNMTSTDTFGAVRPGAYCSVKSCACTNTSLGYSLYAVGATNRVIDCDCISDTGIGIGIGVDGLALHCRCRGGRDGVSNAGIIFRADNGAAINCLCYGGADYGIYNVDTNNAGHVLVGNTVVDNADGGIAGSNSAHVATLLIALNHVTDNGGYAFDNLRFGVADQAAIFWRNRTRDNTSGVQQGYDDWAEATTYEHVTTDTGDWTTDYTNPVGLDFTLIPTAPAGNKGVWFLGNIGAYSGFTVVDPNDIIKSAGGNWDDDNLTNQTDFTANVRNTVIGGLAWTGAYDNATNPNFIINTQGGNWQIGNLSIGNVRDTIVYGLNNTLTGTYDNSTDPDHIISSQGGNWVDTNLSNGVIVLGTTWGLVGVGTLNSTDPGVVNVENGIGYIINSVAKTGTRVDTSPGVDNVRLDETWYFDSVEYTGALEVAGGNPLSIHLIPGKIT